MNLRKIIRWIGSVLAGVFLHLLSASSAQAVLIVADFNDISAAGGFNGKQGGTGFTGSWSGSSNGGVVAGDLTSSLYNVAQFGTAQNFRNTTNALRQNYRTPSATPVGEVWFSLLAMTDVSTHRAGLSLNSPNTTPFDNPGNVYAYLTGSTLSYSFGAGTAGTAAAAAVGSTNLIVGKMSIINGGADSISLWINPNLIANPDIDSITPTYSNNSINFIESLAQIGVISSHGGGHVDNIRISDGGGNSAQAYYDVTGMTAIPEPSSALLVSFGAAAWWRYRRRGRVAA